MPAKIAYRMILCAILSLMIAPSYPINYALTGQDSLASFSENDEVYYMRLAEAMGQQSLKNFLTAPSARTVSAMSVIEEEWITSQSYLDAPHDLLLFFLGKVRRVTGLPFALFGFLLDLFCVTIGLLLFWRLYETCGYNGHAAFLGAFATVALPWVMSPTHFGVSPAITVGNYQLLPMLPDIFSCLPLLRFGPTQISILLFALSLRLLLQGTLGSKPPAYSDLHVVSAAVIAGISIYAYVFAFIALMILSSIILLYYVLKRWERATIVRAFLFLASITAVSAPGLALLSAGDGSYETDLITDRSLRHLIPYSLEWIVVLLCSLLALRSKLSTSSKRFAAASVLLSVTVLLTNLVQPICEKITTPYHFSIFFLTPVFSGLLISLITEKMFVSKGTPQLLIVAAMLGATGGAIVRWSVIADFIRTEHFGFFSQITNLTEIQRIASLDAKHPFSSEIVGVNGWVVDGELLTFLGTPAFPGNYLLYRVRAEEYSKYIENEVLLGWIYSGTPRLAGHCPKSSPPMVTDLHYGIIDWTVYQRVAFCQAAKRLLEDERTTSELICSLAKKTSNRISHLIHDAEIVPTPPALWQGTTKAILLSSTERYRLLEVDWDKMVIEACNLPNASS